MKLQPSRDTFHVLACSFCINCLFPCRTAKPAQGANIVFRIQTLGAVFGTKLNDLSGVLFALLFLKE